MNRLGLVLIAAMVVAGRGGIAAADAGIPSAYKSDTDQSAHHDEIVSKIAAEVAKLGNDADPVAQTAARDWLVNEALLGSNAAATSVSYIDVYTDALNKALEPMVKDQAASARGRLNAVLIAGKVSDAVNSSNLLPTVMAAMADKNEAIAMVAVKAAGEILPAVFKNVNLNASQEKAFLDAIVNLVGEHATTSRAGLIAEDAYAALNPQLKDNTTITAATFTMLADAVISLQQMRLKLYATGFPDSPDADTTGSLFLMNVNGNNRWDMLTPAQKLAAMQNAVNLLWSAAQRAAELPANSMQELVHAVAHEGQLIDSLANNSLHSQDLDAVMQQVTRISIGSIPSAILSDTKAVYPAVQKSSPDLVDLKPPPDLQPLPKGK